MPTMTEAEQVAFWVSFSLGVPLFLLYLVGLVTKRLTERNAMLLLGVMYTVCIPAGLIWHDLLGVLVASFAIGSWMRYRVTPK